MNLKSTSLFVVVLMSTFSVGCSKKKKSPTDDGSKDFEGTWSILAINENGKQVPDRILRNMTATVENGVFRLSTVIKSSDSGVSGAAFNKGEIPLNTFYESALQVDQTKSPAEVNFVYMLGEDLGKARQGIYLIEGNQIKICVGELGAPRPSELVATSNSALIILERKP